MQRIQDILIDLFQEVLVGPGTSPPKLVDIVLEPRRGRVMAKFSDGRRVSAPVRSVDFHGFWQDHAVWDWGSLQQVLLREGRTLYATLTDRHRNEGRPRDDGGTRETLRGSSAHEGSRSVPARLRAWWARQWPQPAGSRAYFRAADLLTHNLSAEQRRQYASHGYFDVVGGNTGNRYRIRQGHQMNVEELDAVRGRVRVLCFMPRGRLVTGDVMLAQKFALELFEGEALRIANAAPGNL